MKTTNKFIAVSAMVMASAILLTGCAKEAAVDTEEPIGEEILLPVSVEGIFDESAPDTKISVNPLTGITSWDENEPIAVYISGGLAGAGYRPFPVISSGSVRLALSTGESRSNYAIAPYASAPTYGYNTPQVTYPATYSMINRDVTSANTYAPTPMVAKNTETALNFYHVGGLLRLHVTDLPIGTTSLEVTFTGKTVTGTFSVTNPGTISALATSTSSNNSTVTFNNLTIVGTECYLNIPIPAGNYNTLTGIQVKATYPSGSSTAELTTTKAISVNSWGTIGHGQGKKMDVSFMSITHRTGYTGGFTQKNYYISKGFLKWDADAGKYVLTDGEDPLEILQYMNDSNSEGVYYHKFFGENSLKHRLDGDKVTNIYSDSGQKIINTSVVVEDGINWQLLDNVGSFFGSTTNGKKLPSGTSLSVNGSTYCACLVNVNLSTATNVNGYDYSNKGFSNAAGTGAEANSKYIMGVLFFPNYTDVICPGISTFSNVDNTKGRASDNQISWVTLKKLIDGGCRFIPFSGSNCKTNLGTRFDFVSNHIYNYYTQKGPYSVFANYSEITMETSGVISATTSYVVYLFHQ